LVIASVDNYAPVSQVAALFKAGARYENGKTIGINHVLRNAAGLTTKDATVFGITRNIEQLGASLTCVTTREHIIYSLQCLRSELDIGLKYLASSSNRQEFRPWELKDYQYRIGLDLAQLKQSPQVQVLENLHKAAFRSGLGNSVYCGESAVGRHDPDLLRLYVNQHFTSSRMAVVAVGVDHDQLVGYVNSLFNVETGPGLSTTPSKYSGGEIRVETGYSVVHAAVATEGFSLSKPQEAFALGVLQHILGTGPRVKRGVGSKLSLALAKVTETPYATSSLNMNYSDSGLFGFYVAGQSEEMAKLLKAAAGVFSSITKSGAISEQDVAAARQKLKSELHMAAEDPVRRARLMGIRAVITKQVLTSAEIDKLVDAVTVADVTNVAKKVVNGKRSMAAVGDLTNTPYIDQLVVGS